MGKVRPSVHGDELQHLVRCLFAMHSRVKDVDDDHRARSVVENGVQRLGDGEARKRGAELGGVTRGKNLDRLVDGAGGRDPHQPDNGGLDDGDRHTAVFDLDRFHAMQKIRGHYAFSFSAGGIAVSVWAGWPGMGAR